MAAKVWLTPKHAVRVSFLQGEGVSLQQALDQASAHYEALRNREWDLRLQIADRLLNLWEESWRQADDPNLDRAGFARELSLLKIDLGADGSGTLFYGDGDRSLFGGHTIAVDVDHNGVVCSAEF